MKFNKLLKESQFHGGRRLAEGNCRWCWYVSMAVLFGLAVAVVCATVGRYFQNPTYLVKQETVALRPHFPSVTVCPEISFRDDAVDTFLSQMRIPPNLNVTYLSSILYSLAAYYAPDVIYRTQDLENVEELLQYNHVDVDTAARRLTTSCETTLIRCRWNGDIVNCSSLFHLELTGVGYCCVFNGRSLSRNISATHREEWHTNLYGHISGLMLAINQSQALQSVDLSYKWLAVQPNQHYVESTINGSALAPGTEQWVEYHQHYFQIAAEARQLSDDLRNCQLAHEPLRFFPFYTRRYCAVECELAHTLKKCNCIRLVHPRPDGAPYCNSQRLLCAKHAMVSHDSSVCDCPLACEAEINYQKITSFNLQTNVQPIDPFYEELEFSKVTVVRVFISHSLVLTESRWSYFNNFDLFAQLGGVFNMFFGCSILTLLELSLLVYHGFASKLPQEANHKMKSTINIGVQKKDSKNF